MTPPTPTKLLKDIFEASVTGHRKRNAKASHDVAARWHACPDKTSSYALTLAAWCRVLEAEAAAFELAVRREWANVG
jgi:cyclopropane fatty-acyl-phospholipid synthase-like methyltransferase